MLKNSFYLVFFLTLLTFALSAEPLDHAALFDQGNRAYAQGNYEEARLAYQKIVKAGSSDSSVFLNLGHADARLGREVSAAINYRRALALEPSNSAARSSLEYVLAGLGVPAVEMAVPEMIGQYISFDLLVLFGSLLFWAGILLVVFAIFSAQRRMGLIILGVLVALVGSTVVGVSWAGDSRIALAQTFLVVSKGVEARSAPAENGQKLANLPQGTPVRVLAAHDGWSLVRLPVGVDGWVKSETIEPVFPGALAQSP